MKKFYYSLETEEKINIEDIYKILLFNSNMEVEEINCKITDLNLEDYIRVYDKDSESFVLIKKQKDI